jgi:hypothetical protein
VSGAIARLTCSPIEQSILIMESPKGFWVAGASREAAFLSHGDLGRLKHHRVTSRRCILGALRDLLGTLHICTIRSLWFSRFVSARSRPTVCLSPLARQLADPGDRSRAHRPLRAHLKSLCGETYRHSTPGVPGPAVLLEWKGLESKAGTFPGLLQLLPRPPFAGRSHPGREGRR